MTEHRIFPHGHLQELAPGLWQVRGSLGIPLYRNMSVVRLPTGALLLHSLVALDEASLGELEKLGPLAFGIIPHAHHQMDAPFYQRRYPSMLLLAPSGERSGIEKNVTLSGTVEEVLPRLGVKVHAVPGSRVKEAVYEVPLAAGGVALIANDVLTGANAAPPSLLGRLFNALAGVPSGTLGVSRFFRWRQVTDLPALRRFLGELAGIPDLRVVTVAHGDPVTADASRVLRAAAA